MQNKTHPKIALIGDVCLDVFMQIPAYPQKGGDGLATSWVRQSGGSAANTAIALAHLGCESQLFARTGSDAWAQQVLSILNQQGVNTAGVSSDEKESMGVTFLAVTPDGERTMFTYRGANALLPPEEITPEKLSGAALLHLSGYACLTAPQSEAVWKAVEIAHKKGIAISLDIGVEPASALGEKLISLLPKLSLLILGEPEAWAIAGVHSTQAAVAFLLAHGVKLVALKLGKDGCQLTTCDRQVNLPGFHVEVVDTTGAGDAFSAAMIYGLCAGWSLEAVGVLANAMGALTTTRWGAGAEMPTRAEIEQFLRSQKSAEDKKSPWTDEVLTGLSA